jgi:hypothetical protein
MTIKQLAPVLGLITLTCFSAVHATDITVYDQNLKAWYTTNSPHEPSPYYRSDACGDLSPFCIINTTQAMNKSSADFITTQENDHILSDNAEYGLDSKYAHASNSSGQYDGSVFYDTMKWTQQDAQETPLTPDGGGTPGDYNGWRFLEAYYFQNIQDPTIGIVIASTHLCVAWGGGATCEGGEKQGHDNDAQTMAAALNNFHSGSPVILGGDFNTTADNNAQNTDIESIMNGNSFKAVKDESGNFVGPTWGASDTYDFVYYNGYLTLKTPGERADPYYSDHAGIITTFNINSNEHS